MDETHKQARREVYVVDLLSSLRAHWVLAALVTLVAAGLGVAGVLAQGNVYLGRVCVSLGEHRQEPEAWQLVDRCTAVVQGAAFGEALAARLRPGEADGLRLGALSLWTKVWRRISGRPSAEPAVSELRRRITVRRLPGRPWVEIGVIAGDPSLAAQLADAVGGEVVAQMATQDVASAETTAAVTAAPPSDALSLRRIELELLTQRLGSYSRAGKGAPWVPGNHLLAKLRADLAHIEQDRALLSAKFGPKHPDMLDLAHRMGAVQTAVGDEVASALAAARAELVAVQSEIARRMPGAAAAAPTRPRSRVIRGASVPATPYRRGQVIGALVATLCGLMAAALLAMALERRRVSRSGRTEPKQPA